MKFEKSCGAVVYRIVNGVLVFLVEHMIQGHTSLPKGHVEGDETEEETAAREIREETNLEVKLDTVFRHEVSYSPYEGIMKQVVFFAAEALPGDLKNQECEVTSLEWLPLKQAYAAMTYDTDKEVLSHAAVYLAEKHSLQGRKDEKKGKMKAEDFEDGTLLKDAIHRFNVRHEEDTFLEICQILRDSYVWIPCNAIVSDEDQKAMEKLVEESGDDLKSMVGKTFTSRENIRMVPDILQNDGKYYFPAFSTTEDMGEYGEHFSKIQDSFLRAIRLARNNTQYENGLTGIAINAFTEPFVLPNELYEVVEEMTSRVE